MIFRAIYSSRFYDFPGGLFEPVFIRPKSSVFAAVQNIPD